MLSLVGLRSNSASVSPLFNPHQPPPTDATAATTSPRNNTTAAPWKKTEAWQQGSEEIEVEPSPINDHRSPSDPRSPTPNLDITTSGASEVFLQYPQMSSPLEKKQTFSFGQVGAPVTSVIPPTTTSSMNSSDASSPKIVKRALPQYPSQPPQPVVNKSVKQLQQQYNQDSPDNLSRSLIYSTPVRVRKLGGIGNANSEVPAQEYELSRTRLSTHDKNPGSHHNQPLHSRHHHPNPSQREEDLAMEKEMREQEQHQHMSGLPTDFLSPNITEQIHARNRGVSGSSNTTTTNAATIPQAATLTMNVKKTLLPGAINNEDSQPSHPHHPTHPHHRAHRLSQSHSHSHISGSRSISSTSSQSSLASSSNSTPAFGSPIISPFMESRTIGGKDGGQQEKQQHEKQHQHQNSTEYNRRRSPSVPHVSLAESSNEIMAAASSSKDLLNPATTTSSQHLDSPLPPRTSNIPASLLTVAVSNGNNISISPASSTTPVASSASPTVSLNQLPAGLGERRKSFTALEPLTEKEEDELYSGGLHSVTSGARERIMTGGGASGAADLMTASPIEGSGATHSNLMSWPHHGHDSSRKYEGDAESKINSASTSSSSQEHSLAVPNTKTAAAALTTIEDPYNPNARLVRSVAGQANLHHNGLLSVSNTSSSTGVSPINPPAVQVTATSAHPKLETSQVKDPSRATTSAVAAPTSSVGPASSISSVPQVQVLSHFPPAPQQPIIQPQQYFTSPTTATPLLPASSSPGENQVAGVKDSTATIPPSTFRLSAPRKYIPPPPPPAAVVGGSGSSHSLSVSPPVLNNNGSHNPILASTHLLNEISRLRYHLSREQHDRESLYNWTHHRLVHLQSHINSLKIEQFKLLDQIKLKEEEAERALELEIQRVMGSSKKSYLSPGVEIRRCKSSAK